MAQEIADSKLIDTWSSSGTKIEPDISKIIEGWQLGEQPPHEYMNWLQNTFGSKLNHILKNGIAKWDDETEYLAGASVQHSGSIWLCETTNTNSEPTDSNANWEKVAINKDLTVTVDTLDDLRSISYPANTVWASGYHTKNDGAFGSHIFRLKGVKTTETDNGGTVIIATIGGTDYVYELQYDGAVNVKWFGAVGDGITDDTIAIQNAISLGSTGRTNLYIPTGTYIIRDELVLPEELKGISGDTARSTILKFDLPSSKTCIKLDTLVTSSVGCVFEHFKISMYGYTANIGFQLRGYQYCYFTEIYIEYASKGLYNEYAYGSIFTNCSQMFCTEYGIYTLGNSNAINFINNRCQNNIVGARLYGNNVTFTGGIFEQNTTAVECASLNISSCSQTYFEANGTHISYPASNGQSYMFSLIGCVFVPSTGDKLFDVQANSGNVVKLEVKNCLIRGGNADDKIFTVSNPSNPYLSIGFFDNYVDIKRTVFSDYSGVVVTSNIGGVRSIGRDGTDYYPSSASALKLNAQASNNYTYLVGRSTANTDKVFGSQIGGTFYSYIEADGSFHSLPNSYGGVSDIKLKENIVATSSKLEDIMKLRVVNFNFKNSTLGKQIGLIAQEVEEVFPSLVTEIDDVILDEYGNESKIGTVTKSVKYSVFVPILLKAIQELKNEVDLLNIKNKEQ